MTILVSRSRVWVSWVSTRTADRRLRNLGMHRPRRLPLLPAAGGWSSSLPTPEQLSKCQLAPRICRLRAASSKSNTTSRVGLVGKVKSCGSEYFANLGLCQATRHWPSPVPTWWTPPNSRISPGRAPTSSATAARRACSPTHLRCGRLRPSAWDPPTAGEWSSKRCPIHRRSCWATSTHQREFLSLTLNVFQLVARTVRCPQLPHQHKKLLIGRV